MTNFFSKNLKYLRKNQGLTQQDLADIVGKKKSIVGNYEKGNVEASIETVQKLADYFTVNWVNLLGTDFSVAFADDKAIGNNQATTTVTTTVAITNTKELLAIRKENAQKDKKIEKLEAQILKMQTQIKQSK